MKATLYHVIRDREVNIGDVLNIGDEYNFFANRLFAKSFMCGDKDLNEAIVKCGVDSFNNEEKNTLKNYVYESCAIIRELALENYRLTHCPQLPSRLKCLFACETIAQARKWKEILPRMSKTTKSLTIVELSVDGEIFKADGNLMLRNTKSVFDKMETAEKYWNPCKKLVEPEVLFVGQAKITKIVDYECR